MKLGRDYVLTIGPQFVATAVGGDTGFGKATTTPSAATAAFASGATGPINANTVIKFPLTLEFDIQRSTLSSANTGHFKLFNLKEDTRKRIFKDRYAFNIYRPITLAAGYSSPGVDVDDTGTNQGGNRNMGLIFQGNILSAFSYRVKQDWITEIDALDGGFGQVNGQAATTFPASIGLRDVVVNLFHSMPKTAVGVIGEMPADQRSRGFTVMGNSWDTVKNLLPDHQVFIDNEKANVLGQDEYLGSKSKAFVINSDSGLLGTPRRYNIQLDVAMIFEPQIKVGSLIDLQSLEKVFNGLYKVIGVQHRGVISGAVCGDAVTSLCLWKGESMLTEAN